MVGLLSKFLLQILPVFTTDQKVITIIIFFLQKILSKNRLTALVCNFLTSLFQYPRFVHGIYIQ